MYRRMSSVFMSERLYDTCACVHTKSLKSCDPSHNRFAQTNMIAELDYPTLHCLPLVIIFVQSMSMHA